MARLPRYILPGQPQHVIQRGNNRQAIFGADGDYYFCLEKLQMAAEKHGCAIHAYVLMTNHVHLLLTPEKADSAGLMMKHLGQRYVQYVNRVYRRSGTLWEGRFRSCLTQSEDYVLACYRYIEMNPVRAGMVTHPRFYRWSSYHANGEGRNDALIVRHEQYLRLGRSDDARTEAYRELFSAHLDPELVSEIRMATNGNLALGSGRFQAQIEATLGRRASRGVAGRPRKTKVDRPGRASSR